MKREPIKKNDDGTFSTRVKFALWCRKTDKMKIFPVQKITGITESECKRNTYKALSQAFTSCGYSMLSKPTAVFREVSAV